jgi:hypothetical protein
MSDGRPKWVHTELSESKFRKLRGFGAFISLEVKREMTSADTCRDWTEAKNGNGKVITLPQGWSKVLNFAGEYSGWGLLEFNHLGKSMADTVKKIDVWEESNSLERAEYERLKKKFEG